MRVRSVKLRAGDEFFCTIVVKPPLARLEARDYRVTRSGAVFRCMLIWRTITAADVTTFGTSAKMQPPTACSQAFDATCSAWLGHRVDTIPLGLHRLLSDFLLLQLLRINGRTIGALFESLNLNGVGLDCRTGSRFGLSPASRCAALPRLGRPRRPRRPKRIRPPAPHPAEVQAVTMDAFMSCRLAVSDARAALPNFYNITIRIANVAARLAVLGLRLRDKLGPSFSP